MREIGFFAITRDMFAGDWEVRARRAGGASSGGPFDAAREITIGDGRLTLRCEQGAELSGEWSVTHNDDLLRRPYLELVVGEARTRALITRLRRTEDGARSILNLYLADGSELELVREPGGR